MYDSYNRSYALPLHPHGLQILAVMSSLHPQGGARCRN